MRATRRNQSERKGLTLTPQVDFEAAAADPTEVSADGFSESSPALLKGFAQLV